MFIGIKAVACHLIRKSLTKQFNTKIANQARASWLATSVSWLCFFFFFLNHRYYFHILIVIYGGVDSKLIIKFHMKTFLTLFGFLQHIQFTLHMHIINICQRYFLPLFLLWTIFFLPSIVSIIIVNSGGEGNIEK